MLVDIAVVTPDGTVVIGLTSLNDGRGGADDLEVETARRHRPGLFCGCWLVVTSQGSRSSNRVGRERSKAPGSSWHAPFVLRRLYSRCAQDSSRSAPAMEGK